MPENQHYQAVFRSLLLKPAKSVQPVMFPISCSLSVKGRFPPAHLLFKEPAGFLTEGCKMHLIK